MHVKTFEETPRVVAFRIFGAIAVLLVAMLAIVHPQSMYAAMSSMMSVMR